MYTCMDNGFPVSSLTESDSQVWMTKDDENSSKVIDENGDTESTARLEDQSATVNHTCLYTFQN